MIDSIRQQSDNQRLKRLAWVCIVLIFLSVSGCATSSGREESTADRDTRLLVGHPFENRDISDQPRDGMTLSGVWRIRGAKNTVYLAATTHLITTNQIPFPSSFYAAYHDSEEIYLEVNEQNSRLSNFRLTFQLLRWMRARRAEFVYPKGKTLSSELAPETVARVKEYYGRDFKKMQAMRPVFLVFMLQAATMGNQFLEEGGVEDVFAARARSDRKPIRVLDDSSVNDVVLLALDEMIFEIDREIQKSGPDSVVLEALAGSSETIDERDWRSGNLAAAKEEIDGMRTNAPALYEKIGPERNRKWLPKIQAALKQDKNIMILAGIAHFPGPEGLLQLLTQAGYAVEQLHAIDPTPQN